MRKSTFLRYQEIYLDFIYQRGLTGCSQAEYCRQNNVLPMTLSRALAAADHSADFTHPFPGSDQVSAACPPKGSRQRFITETVEFVEIHLW